VPVGLLILSPSFSLLLIAIPGTRCGGKKAVFGCAKITIGQEVFLTQRF
jgi:hypothetical protein